MDVLAVSFDGERKDIPIDTVIGDGIVFHGVRLRLGLRRVRPLIFAVTLQMWRDGVSEPLSTELLPLMDAGVLPGRIESTIDTQTIFTRSVRNWGPSLLEAVVNQVVKEVGFARTGTGKIHVEVVLHTRGRKSVESFGADIEENLGMLYFSDTVDEDA